jgi:hypothetical protein
MENDKTNRTAESSRSDIAEPLDLGHLRLVERNLDEWHSENDEEAYRDL